MGFAAIVHSAPLRALRDLPIRKLDVGSVLRGQASGPQPIVASALGAFDLDHRMRVVGQRVVETRQCALLPLASAPLRVVTGEMKTGTETPC